MHWYTILKLFVLTLTLTENVIYVLMRLLGDNLIPVTHTEDVGFHYHIYSEMSVIQIQYADDSQVVLCRDCKSTVFCQSDMTHSICANVTVAPTRTQKKLTY